jgi:hydroxymethylbilane synthase
VRLTLGSRGSPLALWQAHHVAGRLREAHAGLDVVVTIIRTEGDQKTDVPLAASGGKGVFVKEIEDALLVGTIDLAVHSLKDLPTDTPAGLVLAAIPQRYDPRDALVSPKATNLARLPQGAVVATGSPRRRAQLLAARPDLRFTLVRGNVDTRVRKLNEGLFDGLILAVAGLTRLAIDGAPWSPIPTTVCLPAPGQGALAIETRKDDPATRRLVEALDDPTVRAAVAAERAFLAALGAGCLAPAGALATVEGEAIAIEAMVGTPDGRNVRRESLSGRTGEAASLGGQVARRILEDGGEAILRASREDGIAG